MSVDFISSASDRMIKGSVYKVISVAKVISGKNAINAMEILKKIDRRVAKDLTKILKAAIANAQNNFGFEDVSRLLIARIDVGKSAKLRRFKARAKGRCFKVHKHYSNVSINLISG